MTFQFKASGTLVPSHIDSHEATAVFGNHVSFNGEVSKAEAALRGFKFEYDDGDQNFGKEEIRIHSLKREGKKVKYKLSCHFCDLAQESKFHGSVTTLILAEATEHLVSDPIPFDFRSTRIEFESSPKSNRILPGSIKFNRPVKWAQAMLKGFAVQYTNTDQDFFLQRVGIQKVTVKGSLVNFETYFQLEDIKVARGQNPAEADKQVKGAIEVVVLAALNK